MYYGGRGGGVNSVGIDGDSRALGCIFSLSLASHSRIIPGLSCLTLELMCEGLVDHNQRKMWCWEYFRGLRDSRLQTQAHLDKPPAQQRKAHKLGGDAVPEDFSVVGASQVGCGCGRSTESHSPLLKMHGASLVSEHIPSFSWMVCGQQSPLPTHLGAPHAEHLNGHTVNHTTHGEQQQQHHIHSSSYTYANLKPPTKLQAVTTGTNRVPEGQARQIKSRLGEKTADATTAEDGDRLFECSGSKTRRIWGAGSIQA